MKNFEMLLSEKSKMADVAKRQMAKVPNNLTNEVIMDGKPEFVTRKSFAKYFGDVISPRYLANLDSKGEGPARMRMGKQVVYEYDVFDAWIRNRMTPLSN